MNSDNRHPVHTPIEPVCVTCYWRDRALRAESNAKTLRAELLKQVHAKPYVSKPAISVRLHSAVLDESEKDEELEEIIQEFREVAKFR